MQAAYFYAGIAARVPDFGTLLRRHAPTVIAEGEGGDLEATVAEAGRERTLAREGKLPNHLVAQGKLHCRSSP
jgi:hypothetical protein